MSLPVFSIQYFGNINYYYHICQYAHQGICIENAEYYIKQTLRNRTYILTANGVMPLIIPVIRQSNKEIISQKEICYKEKWYKKHYTAIVSAYKKSPFFEYYADELLNFLMHPQEKYLFEFNLNLTKKILSILNVQTPIYFTNQYQNNYSNDYRNISETNYTIPEVLHQPYLQVFSDRFPFQKNLSILDLIFNTGPDAIQYLRKN